MKLILITPSEEVTLKSFGFLQKYVVGESPVEKLKDAVMLEYETGIKPLVTSNTNSIKNYAIEAFATNMLIYAVEKMETEDWKGVRIAVWLMQFSHQIKIQTVL